MKVKIESVIFLVLVPAVIPSCFSEKRDYSSFVEEEISISPDGSKFLFSLGGVLYEMSVDGSKTQEVPGTRLSKDEIVLSGAYSPDMRYIVYSLYHSWKGPGEIYLLSLSTGQRKQLTSNSTDDASPSFSPDGTKIVFSRSSRFYNEPIWIGWSWTDRDIFVMDVNDGSEKRITNVKYLGSVLRPLFSPDGKYIVFSAIIWNDLKGDSEHNIYIVDSEGRLPPKPLTITEGIASELDTTMSFDPYFSPDGKKIVFIAYRGSRSDMSDMKGGFFDYEVWMMDLNGSNQKRVINNHAFNRSPVFSPDGKKIYFLSDLQRDDIFEVWVVDVDGENLHRIAWLLPPEAR